MIDNGFVPTVDRLVKERLTGAIILVALIVLLVPELLTGPVRPGAAPASGSGAAANSSEEPPLRSYTISLADDARSHPVLPSNAAVAPQPSGPAQPAEPSDAPPTNAAQVVAPTPATPEAATPEAATPEPPPAPSPKPSMPSPKPARPAAKSTQHPAESNNAAKPAAHLPPKPAAQQAGGWMVQLGVFASKENAEHLAQEVRAKGFKASVTNLSSATRQLYRVRVGPAPDRAAAQELQSRLRASGRAGTVVPYS